MDEIRDPAELGPKLLAALNAADLESIIECYQEDATLELPDGSMVTGHDGIRAFYSQLLASRPRFTPGEPAPALVHRDVALTSTRLSDTAATAEVARQQEDGTWRWVLDRPNVMLRRQ
jgi:ketosteroid isomerase-like protein